jgi:type VI secretion system protein ImpJ
MEIYRYNKVAWSEGVLLTPHHLQQLDRYHEHRLQARVGPLVPYAWGVVHLAIDEDDLTERGGFTLRVFQGVLRSGTPVDVPDVEEAPPRREITPDLFDSASDRLDVYLAVPSERPQAGSYALPGQGSEDGGVGYESRYLIRVARLNDETYGGSELDIDTAALNVRLLFGSEPDETVEKIKIAEVRRDRFGQLSLDEAYVPPSLAISASDRLSDALRDVVQRMAHKCDALWGAHSGGQGRPVSGRYDYSRSDPEILWTLGMLNVLLPALQHYSRTPSMHPEVVYRTLAQGAGLLSVLSAHHPPGSLPSYDHEHLGECIGELCDRIRQFLELAPGAGSSPFLVFPLREGRSERGYPIWQTEVRLDERLFLDDALYLVARATAGEPGEAAALMRELPNVAAVAAPQDVDVYIEGAHGLRLNPRPAPPGTTPPDPAAAGGAGTAGTGSQAEVAYFGLERTGAAWDTIRSRCTLAVHLPQGYQGRFRTLSLELLVGKGV